MKKSDPPEILGPPHPPSVGRGALAFGAGTLVSRFSGLIRDALIYAVLPLDTKDAWIAAFRVPNFFRRILGEGGLSAAFIPLWVDRRQKGKTEEARILAGGVLALILSLVGLLCLLGLIFMGDLIPLWLSGRGFASVPGKWEQTILMARIMLGFLFFISLFAYFMALLNAERKFALSGLAPVGLNVSIIGALYFFKNGGENLIWISALSVTVGGAFQALILVPSLFRAGLFVPPLWGSLFHPIMGQVCRRFGPTVFGVGVLQVLSLINTYFASLLAPGALTYIYQGDRLLELPLSLIAVSLTVSLLPTLSGYWARGDRSSFKNSLVENIKLFYLFGLPASLGLWFLGTDMVRVLFVRGEFTSGEAEIVGSLLKIHAFTLLFSGFLKILNSAFYSMGRTGVPALISLVGLLCHLFMAPFLMGFMGIQGLVLSTSLTLWIGLKLSLWVLIRQVGALPWKSFFPHGLCCLGACFFMGWGLYGLAGPGESGGVGAFLNLIFSILSGALIYFVCLRLLRCPEPRLSFLKRWGL